jgi:hypothetical protein
MQADRKHEAYWYKPLQYRTAMSADLIMTA